MKIAYLFNWPGPKHQSIIPKVLGQVAMWRRLGSDPRIFALCHERPTDFEGTEAIHWVPNSTRLSRLLRPDRIVREVMAWRPDLIYARFAVAYPHLIQLALQGPLVLEINTDDLSEYLKYYGLHIHLLQRMTRGLLLRRAAGLVTVTHELADRFCKFGRATAVVSNGIDLARISPLPPAPNERPHLLFVGSAGMPWHGIDKIISLAIIRPGWHFDIVGYGPSHVTGPHPPNVTLHGRLNPDVYRAIAARATVALATVGLHRIDLNEACTLKVREYLAYGMPVILGGRDTDFLNGADFILQLSNTEDNVISEADRISNFVTNWNGRRIDRSLVTHLDIAAKEDQRLQFFASRVRPM